jgi:transcriptional regulator EpsA
MNPPVLLDGQVQERLLRAIQASVHVRRRHQLFLWAQGPFFTLLPHDILICLRLERGIGASHVECLHSMIFEPDQEAFLCDAHDGLAVRLAQVCEDSGCLPGLVTPGSPHMPQLYEAFRNDLAKAGFHNAIVHGDRAGSQSDASFLILFNVHENIAPMHGHLVQLLLPHLHHLLNHVISQEGDVQPGELLSTPSVSDRELQILQWICSGKSNYEIGVILNISPLTVKNHVQKIFRKFNVHNRAQAVSRAMSLNLLREPA